MTIRKCNAQLALTSQLKADGIDLIMDDDASIDNFAVTLKQIKELGNKMVSDRQEILNDLVYWKDQFESLKKQLEVEVQRKYAIRYQNALTSLKASGRTTDANVKSVVDANDERGLPAADKNLEDKNLLGESLKNIPWFSDDLKNAQELQYNNITYP